MSKSYKRQAIFKEKGSDSYNRTCRRIIKSSVKQIKNLEDLENLELPNPKTLINDWDICDYRIAEDFSPIKRKKKRKDIPKEYRK